jgi:hypothetical protein
MLFLVVALASCAESGPVYNFQERKSSYYISEDETIMIYYKTNNDGKMVELNVDRLLTIEEMILLNPTIDFGFELEGFVGDIFVEPSNTCTDISNDILIPINLEVGNTRYKYEDDECKYKTVDNHNQFKPGYADEYLLTDTIPVASHVEISIIIFNPTELVNFVEIYELPNTFKKVGVNSILINRDKDGFDNDLINYYKDMTIFEQLYLKHQEDSGALDEINGLSADINLMDLNSLTDINPLIDNFDDIYESEITAIEELQLEIGVNFDTETEEIEDEEIAGDEEPIE